jgi:hypothetical protein
MLIHGRDCHATRTWRETSEDIDSTRPGRELSGNHGADHLEAKVVRLEAVE